MSFEQHPPCAQPVLQDRPFHCWTMPDGSAWTEFFRQGNGYLLRFPRLADFEISADGSEIHAWPAIGTLQATMQHLYLNQVLPLALSRLGMLVFHASAIDLNGKGVAFVGASGQGKSTLAASFASSGMKLLTDDGLQVEWRDQELTALPAHPSLRLWEDSQLALIGPAHDLAPAVEYTRKVRVMAGAGSAFAFCDEPRRLHAIYFMGDSDVGSVTIQPMKSRAVLLNLVRHSFLLDIEEKQVLADHFESLSNIANVPIHFSLDYPRQYASLPNVRDAVVGHCAECQP
jgi:hypothetical protein